MELNNILNSLMLVLRIAYEFFMFYDMIFIFMHNLKLANVIFITLIVPLENSMRQCPFEKNEIK